MESRSYGGGVMAIDKVVLQTNIPQIIALQFADGVLQKSPNGYADQLMFTLSEPAGFKIYLPPIVGKKIADARIQPKQPFSICKRELKEGTTRRIEYQIAPVELAAGSSPAAGAVSSTSSSSTTSSIPAYEHRQPHSNGLHAIESANGKIVAVSPIDPVPAAAPTLEEAYGRVLCTAFELAFATRAYAETRGVRLKVRLSDVQAIAATLHISAQRGGAR
jgi:hypothetical protein